MFFEERFYVSYGMQHKRRHQATRDNGWKTIMPAVPGPFRVDCAEHTTVVPSCAETVRRRRVGTCYSFDLLQVRNICTARQIDYVSPRFLDGLFRHQWCQDPNRHFKVWLFPLARNHEDMRGHARGHAPLTAQLAVPPYSTKLDSTDRTRRTYVEI